MSNPLDITHYNKVGKIIPFDQPNVSGLFLQKLSMLKYEYSSFFFDTFVNKFSTITFLYQILLKQINFF